MHVSRRFSLSFVYDGLLVPVGYVRIPWPSQDLLWVDADVICYVILRHLEPPPLRLLPPASAGRSC
jgi:hypothetical protein